MQITNGNILKTFETPITVQLAEGIDDVLTITALDVDIVDGRVYGITPIAVKPIHVDDRGNPYYRPVIFAAVDVMLQVLGVNIEFDFSGDSADYDYSDESKPFDMVFELGSDDVKVHSRAITMFAAMPGAVVTHL